MAQGVKYCLDEAGVTLYEDGMYLGAIRKWGWDALLRQSDRYLVWVRVEEGQVRVTDVTW
jgi:hypothetical protein